MSQHITFKILEDVARDLSGNQVTFPTFLDITFQIRTALKNPNLSVEQLAKLVGAEPLMSVKIIRMANSAALNPSGKAVGDVKAAIQRVGMEAVRAISFAVAVNQLMGSDGMQAFDDLSQRLWEHSAHVAALSRLLARRARLNADEAMFAGLVHDLGVFYLLSRAVEYPELTDDRPALYALLVDWHDNIGHALLSAMRQPESVLKAVLEHETDREIEEIETLSDVLYVANKIANRVTSWRDVSVIPAVDTSMLETIFDPDELEEILEESEEAVNSLKTALM